jgi:BirA family biotin operon repressor/biotin-[acetyl-CoA-carboxylase] ligase
MMRRIAGEAALEFGVEFLYRDFRPYYKEGQERARTLEMYMQKYCGCIFSEEERYQKKPKDLLHPEAIRRELDTRWAGRGEIRYAQEMDSTNLQAKEMARNGAVHGSLAVCENQTAGRGRLQRTWETPAGQALTQTLVLRPKLPPEQVHLITLAAAVAAAQAIRDVCPRLKPGIKWPNDVVIVGKKCVGILCEMALAGDGMAFAVPGVGINVNQTSFEGELAEKATSLLMEMRRLEPKTQPISRRKVLCAYLKRMEDAVDALEKDGLLGILSQYVGSSVTLGSRVRVESPDETFTGEAHAIDETGALLVTDDTGTERRVLCGDVSVRGMMGYV